MATAYDFAEKCMVAGVAVTVFLQNGVKLSGNITEVLEDGFILTRDDAGQAVLMSAVATIVPYVEYK